MIFMHYNLHALHHTKVFGCNLYQDFYEMYFFKFKHVKSSEFLWNIRHVWQLLIFSLVMSNVSNQVRFLGETHCADDAAVRPLSCMYSPVLVKVVFTLEHFAAYIAAISFVTNHANSSFGYMFYFHS
jgi:hypothetical protein